MLMRSRNSPDLAQPTLADFTGTLTHRGTLEAITEHELTTTIWVEEPTLLSLGGWELEVETGDRVEEVWRPRKTWSRKVDGGAVEILHDEG